MDYCGTLNPAIETVIRKYNAEQGFGLTNRDLIETLRYHNIVFQEIGFSHRWYDEVFKVTEILGIHIGYSDFHITGDNSASDMGLEFDLDKVVLCEPYEVIETKYRPIA